MMGKEDDKRLSYSVLVVFSGEKLAVKLQEGKIPEFQTFGPLLVRLLGYADGQKRDYSPTTRSAPTSYEWS